MQLSINTCIFPVRQQPWPTTRNGSNSTRTVEAAEAEAVDQEGIIDRISSQAAAGGLKATTADDRDALVAGAIQGADGTLTAVVVGICPVETLPLLLLLVVVVDQLVPEEGEEGLGQQQEEGEEGVWPKTSHRDRRTDRSNSKFRTGALPAIHSEAEAAVEAMPPARQAVAEPHLATNGDQGREGHRRRTGRSITTTTAARSVAAVERAAWPAEGEAVVVQDAAATATDRIVAAEAEVETEVEAAVEAEEDETAKVSERLMVRQRVGTTTAIVTTKPSER